MGGQFSYTVIRIFERVGHLGYRKASAPPLESVYEQKLQNISKKGNQDSINRVLLMPDDANDAVPEHTGNGSIPAIADSEGNRAQESTV